MASFRFVYGNAWYAAICYPKDAYCETRLLFCLFVLTCLFASFWFAWFVVVCCVPTMTACFLIPTSEVPSKEHHKLYYVQYNYTKQYIPQT